MEKQVSPFAVLVQKEIGDYIYSWKFLILLGIILLTTIGSIITILSLIKDYAANIDLENSFLFLNLFTASDGNLPPFISIISFLGPIMGLALGFDVINVERNRGDNQPGFSPADSQGLFHKQQIRRCLNGYRGFYFFHRFFDHGFQYPDTGDLPYP